MKVGSMPALGLDVGAKRTGIAVSDPDKRIASPIRTVDTSQFPGCLEPWIRDGLDFVVVGEPRQMDGSPSESQPIVQSVVDKLKARWPDMLIYKQDERFTSKMAARDLAGMGLSRSKRQDKARLDQMSAALILQDFLDREGWKNQ